jgi:hypothetical protein
MITKLNTDGTNSTSVNSQPREPNINTLPSEAQQYYVQLKLLFSDLLPIVVPPQVRDSGFNGKAVI